MVPGPPLEPEDDELEEELLELEEELLELEEELELEDELEELEELELLDEELLPGVTCPPPQALKAAAIRPAQAHLFKVVPPIVFIWKAILIPKICLINIQNSLKPADYST